jgi:cytochrome c biogenesis protein CcmG/thiol:disulfide interchange protein DsbE
MAEPTEVAPPSRNFAPWIAAAVVLAVGLALILMGEEVPAPLARGVTAPGFELPTPDGNGRISLDSLRGQVVLVNFWATWCKPCEDEMPAMERLYQSLRDEGFEMLAVSVDEDPAVVSAFRKRLRLSFPILMDPTQVVARRYQTTGFPETVLVDQRGIVVERYVGPRDWDAPVYEERIRARGGLL